MGKIIKYYLLILLFYFSSCKRECTANFIKYETSITNYNIKETVMDRSILTLKNPNCSYDVYEWSPLIYNKTFPNWIEDHHAPDGTFGGQKYKFEPRISDIDVPYVVFKRKNENYFFIIKQKDTLKFKIEKD